MILCGYLVMSLGACQSTPKEAVVVDKSEGFPQESIIEVDNENSKELGIPEYWEETLERSDGFVTIEADYEMDLSEIYNTPVYQYEPKPLSQDRLKELCEYFAENNRLYEVPAMTKDELIAEKEKLENRVGRWGRYLTDFSSMAIVNEKMERFTEAIDAAPENKQKKIYIEPEFMLPYETEEEFVRDWGMRNIYTYYYETDKKIGFAARVEKGQAVDSIIRAINYDSQVGSSTHFLYNQGLWMDEKELNESIRNWSERSNRLKNYLEPLEEAMWTEEASEFKREDAIQIAEKLLEDLDIQDMEIFECVKAVGIRESESWAGFDELEKGLDKGYAITIYPKCGTFSGIAIRRQVYDDLPETIYAPPFYTQKIYMVVTEEGIQRFEWTDISERTGTIVENTKILTFEDMKEKLADHMLYEAMSFLGDGGKEEGYKMQYKVSDIQLRSSYVNAYENPEAAWLLPVWVIELKQDEVTPEGRVLDLSTTTVILSTIDGGYVSAP